MRQAPARFAGEEYWAWPLPGFGDPAARLYVLGLAPAAHGGNRTGRSFTGDASGDWLIRAMHRTGYANRPVSLHRGDGLRLTGAWIASAVRCAPPENRPTSAERDNCLPYLTAELDALKDVTVILALGAFAWNAACLQAGISPRPAFRHGAEFRRPDGRIQLGCCHPQPPEHRHRPPDRTHARHRLPPGPPPDRATGIANTRGYGRTRAALPEPRPPTERADLRATSQLEGALRRAGRHVKPPSISGAAPVAGERTCGSCDSLSSSGGTLVDGLAPRRSGTGDAWRVIPFERYFLKDSSKDSLFSLIAISM
ncbi:uracil-DNA glycosylase family protein [Streptomyces sp. NPDC056244]|uniref:uracil-DNA glycosylase family protein n=1 Tax=Streptomyces sp. NPDC056244 TaxID=3345762 RepID=UPI0035E12D95